MRIDLTLSGINPDLQWRSSPGKRTHRPASDFGRPGGVEGRISA
jgi:hypothetical protein